MLTGALAQIKTKSTRLQSRSRKVADSINHRDRTQDTRPVFDKGFPTMSRSFDPVLFLQMKR